MTSRRSRGTPSAASPPPDPHVAPPEGGPAPEPRAGSTRSALELVGLVIAPTTLVTALALYFGWRLTNARSSYFGLDGSALGFSAQDYLLRSADALFIPLATIVTVTLGAVRLHAIVRRDLRRGDHARALRAITRTAVIAGAALFALGVFGAFKPGPFSSHHLFVPASPGIGIVVLAYGMYLRAQVASGARPPTAGQSGRGLRADVALVCLLVVLSAFWTASVYATALGRGRAIQTAQRLGMRPAVTVYSRQRLHLDGPGIFEQRLAGRYSAYRYRYSGLRLLIRSDDKYFLLPDAWSRGAGAAIVLPDGQGLRFEFAAR
jgi:hypothetical protein